MAQVDSLTIDLASESVTIDLTPSLLDPDPQDIIELLREARVPPPIYAKIACAYVRAGFIDGAEGIARSGLGLTESGTTLIDGEGPVLLWSLESTLLTAKARTSPKLVYSSAVEDIQPSDTKTKDSYYRESAVCVNKLTDFMAASFPPGKASQLPLLTRGIHQMSVRMMDDALLTFDQILRTFPTNVVALVAKARILYTTKKYLQSLKLYQKALQLNPSLDPDPRIGIGLCLWALGHEDRAVKAWERSAELNPNSPTPQALIGLAYLNINRTRGEMLDDSYRRDLIVTGTKHLQAAFQHSAQKSAAASNVLSEVFLKRSGWNRALKLAERTIQFGDTLTLLTEGYVRAGRVCFCWAASIEKTDPIQANDLRGKATKFFTQALEGQPHSLPAGIGLAACQLLNAEMVGATNTLDSFLLRSASSSNTVASISTAPKPIPHLHSDTRNVECATLFLAALRAFPRPGVTANETAQECAKARVLFERAGKTIGLSPFVHANATSQKKGGLGESVRRWVEDDKEMFVEIARLWWAEPGNVPATRTKTSLNEALRVEKDRLASPVEGEEAQALDPRLVNNIAVLSHLSALDMDAPISVSRRSTDTEQRKALLAAARDGYSEGLTTFSSSTERDSDAGICTMLYNLARVYEDVGEETGAREAYEKLLGRHSEYVDAKTRLASLLFRVNRSNEAHDFLKQSLASAPTNLNLRAFYAKFLMDSGLQKPARDFVVGTLKEHDKHDLWSLVALGWITYCQGRENREQASKAIEEKKKQFARAAELYEKALQLDPSCAYAAQGLAICTAEDALGMYNTGIMVPSTSNTSQDERTKQIRMAARDALDIFAKIRESVSDGSVYFNMGHCYYSRDEFDRAIESYETASSRFWNGQNVSGLLCLCRSWYAKAMKDQSYKAINTALQYAQKALFLQPNDKAVLYNIAMIQQKSAEMLFALPPQKRTLKDLMRVIEQARHAQSLFGALAADKASLLPYDRVVADQRRKYGDNMLKRGDEQVAKQQACEAEAQAKLSAARQQRQDIKDKAEEVERKRLEQLRIENAQLAEERKIAREQVQQWTREAQVESDEEKDRKEKRKREKKEKKPVVSGDEDGDGDGGEVPKKRARKSRLKKGSSAPDGEEENAAEFTDDDEEKPAAPKARPRKRVVRDDDDEEKLQAAPRKKQYKSKEILSDTDEDEEMAPPPDPPKIEGESNGITSES